MSDLGQNGDSALTANEAAALLWVIDGLPCMWTGKGECPHCADRRRDYLSARAKLEAMHAGKTVEVVPATWDGLMAILDAYYPADVFTGESDDPGARLIAAIREVRR